MQVANGTSDKETARCHKLLEAGAVRIRWPADADYEELETFSWHILKKNLWREQKRLGWRYSMGELKRQAELRRSGK